jgi:hypothetical protein
MIPGIESWVAVCLTVAILSYVLWRENPAYRVAEAIFVGVSLGNVVVMAVRSLLSSGVNPLLGGDFVLVVPVALGLLLFCIYSKKLGKLSQWPVAVMSGVGVGLAIRGAAHTYIYDQIKASLDPIIVAGDALSTLNAVLVILGTVSTLAYFLFTVEGGKNGARVKTMGRYFMMLFFGAMFGQVAMTRITYITGRAQLIVQFLITLLAR